MQKNGSLYRDQGNYRSIFGIFSEPKISLSVYICHIPYCVGIERKFFGKNNIESCKLSKYDTLCFVILCHHVKNFLNHRPSERRKLAFLIFSFNFKCQVSLFA